MIAPPSTVLQWYDLASKWAAAYPNLVPNELLALIWTESTGNPNAENPRDPSYGLCQVTMPIARAYGNVTVSTALFDPDTNLRCASNFFAYLKRMYSERFPNYGWTAAYNCGEPAMLRGFKDSNYVISYVAHLGVLDA